MLGIGELCNFETVAARPETGPATAFKAPCMTAG